jgi:hypothetical protein
MMAASCRWPGLCAGQPAERGSDPQTVLYYARSRGASLHGQPNNSAKIYSIATN